MNEIIINKTMACCYCFVTFCFCQKVIKVQRAFLTKVIKLVENIMLHRLSALTTKDIIEKRIGDFRNKTFFQN